MPLNNQKKALLLAIEQHNETNTFNIIELNGYAHNLWKCPKQADSNNKEDTKHFVNSLSANGTTKMGSTLTLAFSQPKMNASSTLRQLIFITDGSVGNEEILMQLITSKLEKSRYLLWVLVVHPTIILSVRRPKKAEALLPTLEMLVRYKKKC